VQDKAGDFAQSNTESFNLRQQMIYLSTASRKRVCPRLSSNSMIDAAIRIIPTMATLAGLERLRMAYPIKGASEPRSPVSAMWMLM
jgi:hypothetical protein